MSRSGKRAVVDGRECVVGLDYEFPDDFDFTYCHIPADFIHDKATPTPASKKLRKESHPWLQFRDASKNDQIIFNNKLAEIQNYPVAKPKVMDWHLLGRLGVLDDILRMIETHALNRELVYENVDLWGRILRLNKPVFREWCLEFYSTLEVETLLIDREIGRKQLIHFRLGGVQRHCTIIGFAYLTGMLSKEEMRKAWIHDFMYNSDYNTTKFSSDHKTLEEFWTDISGEPFHNSHQSKVSQIKSKRLRVLHKMITNSFLHRGDNHNKVFSEDLWVLRYFSELSPGLHILAPYILARHMSRYKEKRLICGHFISMIATRLDLLDRVENTQFLSSPIQVGTIGELDFVKSHLLTRDKKHLLADDEAPAPIARTRRRINEPVESEESEEEEQQQQQPQHQEPQPYGFSELRGELRQLAEHQAFIVEQQRYYGSHQQQMRYTMDYYRPAWDYQMEQMYQSRPNPQDRQIPVYSPPELYRPRQFEAAYAYPPFSYTDGGASHHAGTSSFAGEAGSSGAGGSSYDPMTVDPFGVGLFGTQHNLGGGAPSIYPPPDQED